MILLREIQERDLASLERLAQIPGFINLQNDRDFLIEKIQRSQASFRSAPGRAGEKAESGGDDSKYIFVAEDLETGAIVGTSMIAAQHGTEDEPHFYFEVGSEEKYSKSIGTGFIHGTLKLKQDTDGPSEIGGLVIDPMYRNSEARLGRQISFVRFLYLAMNRERFRKNILAELLPPLNKKGQSPLWEADRLCQQDKEFIFSLFPAGKIYTTFLPADARNAIGKVGKDTEPVLHMLKKIGFRYRNQVDPFDGGPHLWAKRDELVPLRKARRARFSGGEVRETEGAAEQGLLCRVAQEPGTFRAAHVLAEVSKDGVRLVFKRADDQAALDRALGIRPGDEVVFMPYY